MMRVLQTKIAPSQEQKTAPETEKNRRKGLSIDAQTKYLMWNNLIKTRFQSLAQKMGKIHDNLFSSRQLFIFESKHMTFNYLQKTGLPLNDNLICSQYENQNDNLFSSQ